MRRIARNQRIVNACLDQLEFHYTKDAYPLDSGDGYPITYTVVYDGSKLVSGEMKGNYLDKYNSVASYTYKYENGIAKLAGIDY